MKTLRACWLIVLLLAGAGLSPASACVNEIQRVDEIKEVLRRGDPNEIASVLGSLEKAYAKQPDLGNTNDLGVARLLTGRLNQAIGLFREAEKKYPGNARVAANLGTALELKGNNTEALTWIREGVRRDPNEHQGSEWLHARILEAKIALAQDPQWLAKHRVLGLDFGNGDIPAMPVITIANASGSPKGPSIVLADIHYQLKERTKFVKPPDPIVGDLYVSAGDLAFAGAGTDPTWDYQSALKYRAPQSDLVLTRIARFRKDHPVPRAGRAPTSKPAS